MERLNIAIDGPAGAGKSTVAKQIAQRLNIRYLDTGAMYRAIALFVLRRGESPGDEAAVERILPMADIRTSYDALGVQHMWLGEEDVSAQIRTPEISMGASLVSRHPCVRDRLTLLQRRVAGEYDVVMDGRDITTNVLKDSPYKFFVTASAPERARRRLLELKSRGDASQTYEQVLSDILRRDEQDSTRDYMPLRVAPDAVVVDTSGLSIEQATERMLACIREKGAKG